MIFPDRKTASTLLTILLFAIVLSVVYVARVVIVIFAFSILFAYLINPIVRFLQRHSLFFKNLRGPHVLEAYLALIVFTVLLSHGLFPHFRKDAGQLVASVSTLTESLPEKLPITSEIISVGPMSKPTRSDFFFRVIARMSNTPLPKSNNPRRRCSPDLL
jgi:predicted PurR-regulated permease PerM